MPVTVLHLNPGRFALNNIRFLIADDAMTCEDLFIGIAVLEHLRVDTKTLLEDHIESLDGTDCSHKLLQRKTTGGKFSRIMLARLNCVGNDQVDAPSSSVPDLARPKDNYYRACTEEDL